MDYQQREFQDSKSQFENSQGQYQQQIDQLTNDVNFYKNTAEQMKQKLDAGELSSGNVQQMQAVIQNMSRRALVEK